MELTPVIIGEILSVVMFLAIIGVLLLGYPVAFTLGGTALIFAVLGHFFGAFDYALLHGLPQRLFGTMMNEVLVAVPLFVFMGVMLERSKIAEALLTTMGQLFGDLRGGLGISVILVGALLAASTGIVGATVVTMGLLSLPAMMRAGYDPKLATGIICASGTLGQIIPPSTVLIFLSDILQGANTAAQAALGNMTPDTVSVGDLFAGAFIPGFLLVALYCGWVIFKAITQPESCPPLKMTAEEKSGLGRRIIIALVPPVVLIVAVLGSILGGIATPTESASVGALGAILLTVVKIMGDRFSTRYPLEQIERILFWFWLGFLLFLVAVAALFGASGLLTALALLIVGASVFIMFRPGMRALYLDILTQVGRSTLTITSMVFVILLGASLFALVFRGLGGDLLVEEFLSQMPGGVVGAVLVVMLAMFFLGFFLDTFEIIFIVVPIAGPVLLKMGVDPIWLGVLMGVNLQTSFLTPPFGFSLFYLRGVAPKSISTGVIYRGVVPFVGAQIIAMGLMWAVPSMATWLPNLIYRSTPVAPPTELELPSEGSFDFGDAPAPEEGGDLFGDQPPAETPSTEAPATQAPPP